MLDVLGHLIVIPKLFGMKYFYTTDYSFYSAKYFGLSKYILKMLM